MHENILQIAEFGNELSKRILNNQVDESERDNYLITIIYIEDILDKYGRGMVVHEGESAGLTDDECKTLKKQVTENMDSIRENVKKLAELHDYQDLLKKRLEGILQQWQFSTDAKSSGETKSADSEKPSFIEEWLEKKDKS